MSTFPNTHKAIVVSQFGGPEELKVQERETPKPEEGQVLLKVEAVGVNPVDTYIRSGNYARKPTLPFTPGIPGDVSGVVVAVGSPSLEHMLNKRYFGAALSGSGGYAQYTLCPVSTISLLPDNVTHEQGAAIHVPYYTAHRAIFHAGKAEKGQCVLVNGASGGVGQACVQFAKGKGLKVIGSAGTQEGLDLVKSMGADAVFNYKDEKFWDSVKEASNGGPNLIIEMLANVNLNNDVDVVANQGRIVVVGNRGLIDGFNPRAVMMKEIVVTGAMLFAATQEEREKAKKDIEEGLANGTLKPVVGKAFGINEAPRAHVEIIGSSSLGKMVLLPHKE